MPRHLQRPVRMRPVQVGIDIDHLRLDPDAEIQPHPIHLPADAGKPARQLLPVRVPVAQRSRVVVSLSEPAVIHHEELHANLLALLREVQQPALIDLEVAGLPAVQEHRPRLLLPGPAHHVLAHEIMHLVAHPVVALIRAGHHRLRRLEALARRQRPREGLRVDPLDHPQFPVAAHLAGRIMIAGIDQVHAVALPLILRGLLPAEHKERIRVGGRIARHRRIYPLARRQREGRLLHLPRPRAGK